MKVASILLSWAILLASSAAQMGANYQPREPQHARDEAKTVARPCPTPAGVQLAQRTPNPYMPAYKRDSGSPYSQADAYAQNDQYDGFGESSQATGHSPGELHGFQYEYRPRNVHSQGQQNAQYNANPGNRKELKFIQTDYTVCESLPRNQRQQCQIKEQAQLGRQLYQSPSRGHGGSNIHDQCFQLLGRDQERCEQEQGAYGDAHDKLLQQAEYRNGYESCVNLPLQQQRQCLNQFQISGQNKVRPILPAKGVHRASEPTMTGLGYSTVDNLTCTVTSVSEAMAMETVWCQCNDNQAHSLYTGTEYGGTACPLTSQFMADPATPTGLIPWQLTQTNEGGTKWKCEYSTQLPDENAPRCLGVTSTIFAPTPAITVIPATGDDVYIGNMSSTALSVGLSDMLATSCTIPGTRGPKSVLECPSTMTMPGVYYPKQKDPKLYPGHLVAIQQSAGTFFPNNDVLSSLAAILGATANHTISVQQDVLCTMHTMSYTNFDTGGGAPMAGQDQRVTIPDFPECSMPAEWLITYISGRQDETGINAMIWLKFSFQVDGDKQTAKWDQALCKASAGIGVLSWLICPALPFLCGAVEAMDTVLVMACDVGAAAISIDQSDNAPATKA